MDLLIDLANAVYVTVDMLQPLWVPVLVFSLYVRVLDGRWAW